MDLHDHPLTPSR